MNEIDNSTALQRVLADFSVEKRQQEQDQQQRAGNDLGRNEFLRLLVAQLEHQDPTNPQDNGEFIAQLAQFSQLQESQKMNQSLDEFSSGFQSTQHLQATSLVGRPVHVESEQSLLTEDGAISVLADLDAASSQVTMSVFDETGRQVDQFDLGGRPAGRNEFVWNGLNDDGEPFPPGMYRFELQTSQGGESTRVPTFLSANVNSVTIEPGGSLTLNLAGLGPRSLSDVLQIN